MKTATKKHLVMSLDEQYAIVNALAFYNAFHNRLLDDDELEQFKLAFKEDERDVGVIDELATKIANYGCCYVGMHG